MMPLPDPSRWRPSGGRRLAIRVLCSLAIALSASPAGAQGTSPAGCPSRQPLSFVCGTEHPEDLAPIPDTPWLIVSGFADGAGLKLIDTRSKNAKRWYRGASEQVAADPRRYPRCSSPPDAATFNTQGLSLRRTGEGAYVLYAVNHGGRESVEVFRVSTTTDAEPRLAWQGCLLLPAGMAANSVASFADGTVLVTVLTRPGTTIADFVQGRKTGAVYEWTPRAAGFQLVRGTQLPGNNGLEVSPDQKSFYVVAFGWHAVVKFARGNPARWLRKGTAPDFMPDNIHWDGSRLIAAGMRYDEPACGGVRKVIAGKADDMHCHRGYVVAAVDPATLDFHTLAYSGPNPDFNGVSAGVILEGTLWLGSYQADRLAFRPTPNLQ
jgi:hypothetical protein